MISYQSLAWSILSILGWTCQASAGWVIDQAEKGSGDAGKQQIMLQANQMKTVVLGPDGKPESAFIMDLNTETFTQVNYPEGSYMTAKVQEYAKKMEGAMKQATKTMEDAMKNMSPEQRQAMERVMGSRMPKAGAGPEACPERKLEIRKTDQQATIAGYPAVNYEVVVDGKTQTELWIAKGITVSKELDPQKLERIMSEFSKAVPLCGPVLDRQTGASRDQAWKLVSEGYPVRTVDRGGSGTTVEVIKAESRSIPPVEFQPPANFTRKTLKETMKHER